MKISTLTATLAIMFSASVKAAPTLEQRWSSPSFWTSHSGHSASTRRGCNYSLCDLSKARLPQAPTPLPPPSYNLSLSHVSIGRGTQNYTCDLSNSTSIPVAAGATAALYNVSCIAANHPTLLSLIPGIAINLPLPTSSSALSPINMELSGHHYFLDATTPFFNLDTEVHSYGIGAFKKLNATSAPEGAVIGVDGSGMGAVPWLKLTEKFGVEGSQKLKEVFRVNTAGGQPPATCQGQQESILVEYAAEYWVYV
ncbi:hypothetical protein M438DRAFT_407214 [Aureobasidium pullulans EXF-150]|uniref:Malate dehydrogenase n=1 Tax=Aureobasidium pullulans EXF-150 TaxID=1043002 RepID=A0A074XAG7_AURPU|nr:uncharacterized protein M438DRAFT_407214 [Aureobasidium pullulans EXF-150]KEQ82525.1 hypothetical protein M438DRAFT_407214 [Aureobasidium pullulans EXF-150]